MLCMCALLVVCAIGLAGCIATPSKQTREQTQSAVERSANDMKALREVDPKLVKWHHVATIETGLKEPRGIDLGIMALYVVGDHELVTFDAKAGTDYALQQRMSFDDKPMCVTAHALDESGTFTVGFGGHIERHNFTTPYSLESDRIDLEGEWHHITSVAIAGEDIFIGDSGHGIVFRYNWGSLPLGRIGEKDEARGIPGLELPSPYLDVAAGPNGTIVVNNPGRRQVETYDKDGNLLKTWGVASQSIEGFCGCCNPTNIAVFRDGRVVTAEKGLPRVKVYTADGTLESVVATPEDFSPKAAGMDLAIGRDGRIYVLDPQARVVKVFAPNE